MTKTISLRISPDLDRKARVKAALRDMSRSDYIRWLLTSDVAGDDQKLPTPQDHGLQHPAPATSGT